MALISYAKKYLNSVLKHVNVRVETLTAESVERKRLEKLANTGQFDKRVFPIPFEFSSESFEAMVRAVEKYHTRLDDFEKSGSDDVGYTYHNDYFSSPDVEILYTLVRDHKPETVIEVGCGNSTKIIRQAIIDGQLNAKLISIDPDPRVNIKNLADQWFLEPVESLNGGSPFASLKAGDMLFIDSSHLVKCGNDVTYLYLNVLPTVPAGVWIHIHDIFLPYDYPRKWLIEEKWEWNEQYLVQSFLAFSNMFEVVWPAHYLQRTREGFLQYFPRSKNRLASSLWLRKVR